MAFIGGIGSASGGNSFAPGNSIGPGGGNYTGPAGPFLGGVPSTVAPPDTGNTGADFRASVYGKPIQLSQGNRALTGYPIWCGNYVIPGGSQVVPHALAGINYVPPANLLSAWPNAINAFAIAFGYQLAPAAERNTLKVRQIYANGVKIYSAAPAQAGGRLTATANFANGETVTINGATYTFQTTLTNVSGNVKIGATLAASLVNIRNCINVDGINGVPNTDYAAATPAHPTVYATNDGTHLIATARAAGTAANSYGTTETCAAAAWGAATLTGGTDVDTVTKVGSFNFTLYQGTAAQTADPIIAADRGNLTPGFRDLVYIVFSNFQAGQIAGTDPYTIPTITVEFSEPAFPLSSVLRHLALNAGYDASDIDVDSALTESIPGVNIADRYDADQLFDDLGLVYGFKHFESEGKKKFIKDTTVNVAYALTRDNLSALSDGDDSGFVLNTTLQSPSNSPYSMQVSFLDNYLYAWAAATFTQDGQVLKLGAVADKQIKIPFVMATSVANAKAASAFYALDAMTIQQSIRLSPRYLLLEPSDVLQVTVGSYTYKVQISEMTINADLSISINASNFDYDRNIVPATIADFPSPIAPPAGVEAGSQTFDGPSASGNFPVPLYNTLTIEVWGPGGGSGALTTSTTAVASTNGTNPGDSTAAIGGSNLLATGGKTGLNQTHSPVFSPPASVGGIPSGGDTNANGENGGAGIDARAGYSSAEGAGGFSPNGGAHQTVSNPGTNGNQSSAAGNAPGGGAKSGLQDLSGVQYVAAGGAGGAYVAKTFTFGVTFGAPAPGSLIPWAIGANGTGGTITGGSGTNRNGANGAAGRVKFTWA